MFAVRPSAKCKLGTKPFQSFDACTGPGDAQFRTKNHWIQVCWDQFYTGLHEGLDVQDASEQYACMTYIGHVLASYPNDTYALLDYCVRRGFNVSCCNKRNKTVLCKAIQSVDCYQDLHKPTTLHFFQVLADAHAMFDVSTNETAKLIRNYIAQDTHMSSSAVIFLNQVAELFDK
jgi:hypothetical protein